MSRVQGGPQVTRDYRHHSFSPATDYATAPPSLAASNRRPAEQQTPPALATGVAPKIWRSGPTARAAMAFAAAAATAAAAMGRGSGGGHDGGGEVCGGNGRR